MDNKSLPWVFLVLGITAVAVVVLTREPPKPVIVETKSGGNGGGWAGALSSLVGLGTAVVSKLDF